MLLFSFCFDLIGFFSLSFPLNKWVGWLFGWAKRLHNVWICVCFRPNVRMHISRSKYAIFTRKPLIVWVLRHEHTFDFDTRSTHFHISFDLDCAGVDDTLQSLRAHLSTVSQSLEKLFYFIIYLFGFFFLFLNKTVTSYVSRWSIKVIADRKTCYAVCWFLGCYSSCCFIGVVAILCPFTWITTENQRQYITGPIQCELFCAVFEHLHVICVLYSTLFFLYIIIIIKIVIIARMGWFSWFTPFSIKHGKDI